MTELEKNILGVASNEKEVIEIIIDKPTFLQRLKRQKVKKYEVNKYTTLSQNIEITKILKTVPEFNFEGSDSEKLIEAIDVIDKYTLEMIKIISIVLKEKDLNFLLNNLSNADMFKLVFDGIFGMINFQAFTNTMASVRNKTQMTSPQESK